MPPFSGKKMVVIGGSRGLGRGIVECGARHGARVLAVARGEAPLRRMVDEVAGIEVLALDATEESAPSRVFEVLQPDVLVVAAGAPPPAAPLHEQTWQEFAVNWDSDVKIAFHFCRAALLRPLPAGALVILIASWAALGGSPLTGGYAGAKRTQMLIANYSQKESDRLGLGLRFATLAPPIVPDTRVGWRAVSCYARYLGIPASEFIRAMDWPPASYDIAAAVIELAANPDHSRGRVFVVTRNGMEAVSLCQ